MKEKISRKNTSHRENQVLCIREGSQAGILMKWEGQKGIVAVEGCWQLRDFQKTLFWISSCKKAYCIKGGLHQSLKLQTFGLWSFLSDVILVFWRISSCKEEEEEEEEGEEEELFKQLLHKTASHGTMTQGRNPIAPPFVALRQTYGGLGRQGP